MQIQKLRVRDQKKAIAFAIEGMHFNKFTKNEFLLRLYGRYYWYLAYTDATDVLAAYEGETLLGVLTVHMHSEKRPHRTALRLLFIKFAEWVQKLAFGKGAEPYSRANLQMYGEYFFRYRADGEIGFLAADPKLLKRGVGSFLLRALEERYPDRELYLFTDESPDAADKNFLDCLNPDSLEVLTGCKVEADMAGVTAPASFQFMRLGYFCLDNKDSAPGHLVFNRSVSLKDSFKK